MQMVQHNVGPIQLQDGAAQVRPNGRHHFALHIDGAEEARGGRQQAARFVAHPQIRMVEIGGAFADKLNQAGLLDEPEIGQRGGGAYRFGHQILVRIGEALQK